MLSVIYTAEKYEHLFVFNSFLKFMVAKQDSPDFNKFLFYLYIRQYYKVYTGTNFMAILNSRKDLSKEFKLNYKQAIEIIKMAYSDDSRGFLKLIKALQELKNKKSFTLYHFLKALLNEEMSYKSIDFMQKLLDLHQIKQGELKNPEDVQEEESSEQND